MQPSRTVLRACMCAFGHEPSPLVASIPPARMCSLVLGLQSTDTMYRNAICMATRRVSEDWVLQQHGMGWENTSPSRALHVIIKIRKEEEEEKMNKTCRETLSDRSWMKHSTWGTTVRVKTGDKQVGLCKFKASLVHTASSRPTKSRKWHAVSIT